MYCMYAEPANLDVYTMIDRGYNLLTYMTRKLGKLLKASDRMFRILFPPKCLQVEKEMS